MAFKEVQTLDAEKTVSIGVAPADYEGKTEILPTISGYYLGYKTVESKTPGMKASRLHMLSIEGKIVGVWGSAVMNKKLAGVAAPSNPLNQSENGLATMVQITYTGLGKKNPSKPLIKPAKQYSVKVDDENTSTFNVASLENDYDADTGFDTGSDIEDLSDLDAPPSPQNATSSKDRAARMTAKLSSK